MFERDIRILTRCLVVLYNKAYDTFVNFTLDVFFFFYLTRYYLHDDVLRSSMLKNYYAFTKVAPTEKILSCLFPRRSDAL